MAAATQNSRQDSVFGNKRVVTAQLDLAATGDTYDTELSQIDAFFVTPATGIGMGGTKSGGVVTIEYAGGGAAANVQLIAIGN